MLYMTYGYICLAKNIYNLEAFRKSNDKAIKKVNAMNGTSIRDVIFEYTTDKRVMLGFGFTDNDLENVKEMYETFVQELKIYFPSLEVTIKVETIVETVADKAINSWFGFDKRVLDCVNED